LLFPSFAWPGGLGGVRVGFRGLEGLFGDLVHQFSFSFAWPACCWILNPLMLIWNELRNSFQQKLGYVRCAQLQDVRRLSNGDYILDFLNYGMNCRALGRWALRSPATCG
jgi:hypothetical protein